jgi:hypothetical protein
VTNSGNIVLDNNVPSDGNSGCYPFLDNPTDNGSVTLTGTNTFKNNGSDGLHIITRNACAARCGSISGNGCNEAGLDNSVGGGDVTLQVAGTFKQCRQ